jgi:hypothetical protein
MAKGEWKRSTQLIDLAVTVLESENPMTIRQLFYRLVSAGAIANGRTSYQLVSRLMTKARDDGRCDFNFIVDRSRPEYAVNVFTDAAEYARVIKRGYRKDYWSSQPKYVELWVEKDAIIGSIQDVTTELGIIIRVGRGFLSTTKAHEIAAHFASIEKDITVFYLGDHDPSGRAIETDLYQRIREYGCGFFELKRLAIHKADIRKFRLPPLKIKTADSRSLSFQKKYGEQCVELDALPPTELRGRIRIAVSGLIDQQLWRRAIYVETAELASIESFANKWMDLCSDTPTA